MQVFDNINKTAKDDLTVTIEKGSKLTGSVDGRTTLPKFKATLNNVLTCFSPIAKDKRLLMPNDNAEIAVLIGTDCISEGQNLQDCGVEIAEGKTLDEQLAGGGSGKGEERTGDI